MKNSSKMMVLDLQSLTLVSGGRDSDGTFSPEMRPSNESMQCGSVTHNEDSTRSVGCTRETKIFGDMDTFS